MTDETKQCRQRAALMALISCIMSETDLTAEEIRGKVVLTFKLLKHNDMFVGDIIESFVRPQVGV